jgi:hypothetical protein
MFDIKFRGTVPLQHKVDGRVDAETTLAVMNATEDAFAAIIEKREADRLAKEQLRAEIYGGRAELCMKLETAKKGDVIELSDGTRFVKT